MTRRTRHSATSLALGALMAISGAVLVPLSVSAGATDPETADRPDAVDVARRDSPVEEPAGFTLDPNGPIRPSVQYEDAMAHADDQIAFDPGERVTVGFKPRAGDTWSVGGRAPRALPAGHATGRQSLASEKGQIWAAGPPPEVVKASELAAPIDGPTLDPATIQDAAQTGALAAQDASVAIGAGSGLRREVFGFLPYWELSDSTTVLDYRVLSTIAYFSVGSDSAGNLLKTTDTGAATTGWAGWTSSRMTTVINQAHTAGTRVVLTISMFAWTTSQANAQAALLGSATARGNLARQVAAAVRDRGADGVNLDFEPIVSGYSSEFTAFVRSVRAELDAIAPGYQLTFDTTGWIGNYPLEDATAPGGADAIFIMGYDYRGSSADPVGSIAPLGGPTYDITDTILAYTARVSPSRLILGVPYYGRAWSTDTDQVHARNISGTQYGPSATAFYASAMEFVEQYGRRWDAIDQVAWTAYRRETCTATFGCVTAWRQLYLDDRPALEAKYDLVNRYNLRGTGMWALGYDDTRPELYQALAAKFLNDTTTPLAGVTVLPQTQVDAGFVVNWTGTDDIGVVSYDVQVSATAGPWQAWLNGTTATSDVWLGSDGVGYAFRARARDAHGNTSAWDVSSLAGDPTSLAIGGFGQVDATTLSVRAEPTTSATKLATLSAGDTVAITGGPVAADGYTWYQITGPLNQWSPVTYAPNGVWVAASGGTTPYVVPRRAPNASFVDAGIAAYDVGPTRLVSPNGDGRDDSVVLSWSNELPFSSLTLSIYRADGALIGTRSLTQLGSGGQSFNWNGAGGPPGSAIVPDGTYILQLVGVAAGTTYSAPSARPVTAAQVAAFGITVDHQTVTRLFGADRYATAAAISAATYAANAT
ncbi:MAG: glycosyl hydrolase family 18 protein, partial [Chloroflexota bacterium]